ncbi:MAG: hypothetical protein ABI267_08125 [Ginsengibacter sp.]
MAFKIIIIKSLAYIDLDEAMLWYENEPHGLALQFFNSFENAIKKVKRNPEAFYEC